MQNMLNVLITGVSGYIGSQLVNHLLPFCNVIGVDNFIYKNDFSLLSYISRPNFTFEYCDVRDSNKLKDLAEKVDIVIPLACLVGMPLCEKNKTDAKLVNFSAVQFLAMNKRPEQIIIYLNSNSGYGQTDGRSVCTEETEMNPNSLYGKTKYLAEQEVVKFDNHIVFRLATIFGPSRRPRTDLLINNLVLRAMKDKTIVLYEGTNYRNYLHIEDICRAIVFAIQNIDTVKNEVYNVGNDAINMSKLDLCKTIQKYVPLEIIQAEYTKDPDKRNYIISSQKFYDKGFKCQYDLDDGIKQLIKMYQMIDTVVYANY